MVAGWVVGKVVLLTFQDLILLSVEASIPTKSDLESSDRPPTISMKESNQCGFAEPVQAPVALLLRSSTTDSISP